MPLRAIIDNKEVLSIDFNNQEWSVLKDRIKKGNELLYLPCCGQQGFLRTSSKGLNHFYHKPGINCDWKPETPQHLKTKVEIIKACRKNGWVAIPEYSQNDWRADVLAVKKNLKVAFEVQWSKQKTEETITRQEKYEKDNVKACWFFRTIPKELKNYSDEPKADKKLPLFKMYENVNSEIIVSLGSNEKGIYEFIDDLLNKKIKYCEHYRAMPEQEIEITFYEKECCKCKKVQFSYFTKQKLLTCCNNKMRMMNKFENDIEGDLHPQIINFYYIIDEILNSNEGKNIVLGKYNCNFCGEIFDYNDLTKEKIAAHHQENNIVFKRKVKIRYLIEEHKHWCYSHNGNFCE